MLPENTLGGFFHHRDFNSLSSLAFVYRLTHSALTLGAMEGDDTMYTAETGVVVVVVVESLKKFLNKIQAFFKANGQGQRASGRSAYGRFPG